MCERYVVKEKIRNWLFEEEDKIEVQQEEKEVKTGQVMEKEMEEKEMETKWVEAKKMVI